MNMNLLSEPIFNLDFNLKSAIITAQGRMICSTYLMQHKLCTGKMKRIQYSPMLGQFKQQVKIFSVAAIFV
jgi:hypothetical protein